MRKFVSIFLVCCLLLTLCPLISASEQISTSAKAFVLADEFGDIIFENNAHIRLPMASTTKIMTAVVALEYLEIDQTVEVPREAVGIEGSSAYLIEGESLCVNDLLHALLLRSANDAAVALAVAAKGDVESFCGAMNEKARSMGLVDTHFDNPHGLDSKDHYTTAYELSLITAKALELPDIAQIMGTKTYTCRSKQGNQREFVNHNKLLSLYENCIGGKTGYTKSDGRCLASAAELNGVRLIAVTLDAPDDWNDHQRLYDAGFAMYKEQKLCDAFEYSVNLNVVGANDQSALCHNNSSVYAYVRQNCEISAVIEAREFEYAPINEYQSVGRVVFLQNGNEIAFAELVASENIEAKSDNKKSSLWDKIIKFIKRIFAAIF